MSDSSVPHKHGRLIQFWQLAGIALGIAISFFWAAFLVWLILSAFSGLI
jgi:hypothetical protein